MKKLLLVFKRAAGSEKWLARTAQVGSVGVGWSFGMSELVGGSMGRERALAGICAVRLEI